MPRNTFVSRFHITKSQAFRAFDDVCRELRAVGLMKSGGELESVECMWHPEGIGSVGVLGFGFSDLATEGYYWNRTIHLPAWGYWFRSTDGIRNVVRHEFGHAFADIHRAELRRPVFRRAFGAECGLRTVARFRRNWKETCVSEYASTNTQEDWAETFMLFLQHKGRLPARFRGLPAIEAKWNAVKTILGRVRAARTGRPRFPERRALRSRPTNMAVRAIFIATRWNFDRATAYP